jgi:hypothetical protein
MDAIALPAPVSTDWLRWLISLIRYQGQGGILPYTPFNGYVAEDGVTFYVGEDGATYYIQES